MMILRVDLLYSSGATTRMTDEIIESAEPDPKTYLEYLDKEMTIMSVLSTVSVLAAGGVLNSLLSSDKCIAREVWAQSHNLILAGASLSILAATFFYKQRSELAWHYGQICLCLSRSDASVTNDVGNLLTKADSWASWYPYSWGWTCLIGGLISYGAGLGLYLWLPKHLSGARFYGVIELGVIGIGVVAIFIICHLQYYVLTTYSDEDDYWALFSIETNFWARLLKKRYLTRSLDMIGKVLKLP